MTRKPDGTWDKSALPSRHVTEGPTRAPHRSFYYAMGLGSREIAQPFVGVVSCWNEAAPCNTALMRQAHAVSAAVKTAGATPREFCTITVTDGIAMGHEGMRSSLVSREVIADSVELTVRGHSYDALVGVAGCDKSLPGMMMAMLRLNIPSVFLYGGSILPGRWRDRDVTVVDVFEEVGEHSAGRLSLADLGDLERRACPGDGACGGQFTANTMACVSEAIGLALPLSAALPAPYESRDAYAAASGEAVVRLIESGVRPRDICTREAFEYAAAVVAATGGSTNGALHLPAMAHECGVPFSLRDVVEISRRTPHLADLKPGGRYVARDMGEAGGVPALLRTLLDGGYIHGECLTVTGKTMAQNLADVSLRADQDVIRPLAKALSPSGGLVGLWGSLAPDGAVVKVAGMTSHRIPTAVRRGSSTARKRASRPSRSAPTPTAMSLSFATKDPRAARACAKCCRLPPPSPGRDAGPRSPWSPMADSPAARAVFASATSGPRLRTADRSAWSATATSSPSTRTPGPSTWKLAAAELAARRRVWRPRETLYGSGAIWKFAQGVGPAHLGAVTHPGLAGERRAYPDL